MRLKDPRLPAAAGPPSLLLFFASPVPHLTSLCWVLAVFVGAVRVLSGSCVCCIFNGVILQVMTGGELCRSVPSLLLFWDI